MTPRRLVATLLEADDLLPEEQPIDPGDIDDPGDVDPKTFASRASSDIPMPGQGVNIRGTHQNWLNKFRQKRLHRDGNEEFFRVDRNTWLVHYTDTNNIAVRFHQTDILTVTPEDTLTVDNGGYLTVTTLARMNDWLPSGWSLYKLAHEWWWNLYRHNDEELNPGYRRLQPYSNGDMIEADGLLHPKEPFVLKKTRVPRRAI